jgi:hypothetical protein
MDVGNHWKTFLQRNRDFVSNKDRALEGKRKAKQDELDKSCTFAPKVQDWSLKVDEGDMETESSLRCDTRTKSLFSSETAACSEDAQSKIESDFLGAYQQGAYQQGMDSGVNESRNAVEHQVSSFSIQDDSCEALTTTADCPDNRTVIDVSGPCSIDSATESGVDRRSEDLYPNQVSETRFTTNLPLEAWKEEEEDRTAVAGGNQGPARLSCSPSGKLVVSNLASEVILHNAWPCAKLLFADCDDSCEKKLPVVSPTASTEVSNCPSESGGADNEDDDLDTLVANLRSHKVYSFHFSG